MAGLMTIKTIPLLFILLFFAITFLQSAIDKLIDWKGNLGFLKGHFKNSPFCNQVPALLGILTLVELLSGFACSYAILRLFLEPTTKPVICALTISGLNLIMLLFGQRLAKDYAGAATIGGYMIIVLLGFSFL